MIRKLKYLTALVVLLTASFSCTLEETFESPTVKYEGMSDVCFQVDFRPLSPALESKASGDAISHVYNLSIVVYHADGVFHSYEYLTSADLTQQEITADKAALQTNESKYQRSTFSKSLPTGNFRIYAVANLDRQLTGAEMQTEDALKSISLTWNNTALGKAAESALPDNNVMFGFFTDTESTEIPSSAPVVSIDKAGKTLHAWVRRAASKVTVSFDGSALNEDVWISFKSVQIKDIPKTCPLGRDNTPASASDLIENGEIIYFSNSDDISQWPYIAKGIPYFGSDHSETAEALYFFENMQGVDNADIYNKYQLDENGDGVVDGNDEIKDMKPYGTYIEVKAYYVNKSENTSQGEITYRFMLGKNISNDFNAGRNMHYKLNLKFKGDANNVDWHIDYVMDNPEISVATPLYISYLHRQSLDVPVVVRGGEVTSLTAEIVDNPWYYEEWFSENPAITRSESDYDYNGFLSFKEPTANNQVSMTAAERQSDFDAGKSITIDPSSGNVVENALETRFKVPVWTRALLLGDGFSGNNAWVHKERIAQVKFTAKILYEDGTTNTVSQTVDIKQVKRLVNPTGVWRKNGSDKPFNVVLMSGSDEQNFNPLMSDGAWTATVVSGKDWVKIADSEAGLSSAPLDNVVRGYTGSTVDFWYKPADGNASQTRCGVIEILYHGNQCCHYIFVSQGSTPVTMTDNGTRWHMSNVYRQGVEGASPLAEGSMFRYLNYAAILPENNWRSGMGLFEVPETYQSTSSHYTFNLYDGGSWYSSAWPLTNDDENGDGAYESEYRLRINDEADWSGIMNGNGTPGSVENWSDLEELPRFYGVMYGDDSYAVKTTAADAYQYLNEGDDKGMRGMFVWDRDATGLGSGSGNHIFFPIGSTGHGHRKQYDDKKTSGYQKIGVLRYATTSEPLNPSTNSYRPMLYNLYLSPGAIYWTSEWGTAANTGSSKSNAYDINYETYDFNEFSGNAMYYGIRGPSQAYVNQSAVQSSDACFIRCVD